MIIRSVVHDMIFQPKTMWIQTGVAKVLGNNVSECVELCVGNCQPSPQHLLSFVQTA